MMMPYSDLTRDPYSQPSYEVECFPAQRPERADQLDAAERGVGPVADDGRAAGADQPGGAARQHQLQRGAAAQDVSSKQFDGTYLTVKADMEDGCATSDEVIYPKTT